MVPIGGFVCGKEVFVVTAQYYQPKVSLIVMVAVYVPAGALAAAPDIFS